MSSGGPSYLAINAMEVSATQNGDVYFAGVHNIPALVMQSTYDEGFLLKIDASMNIVFVHTYLFNGYTTQFVSLVTDNINFQVFVGM
jgi:hypothetical protein